MEAPEEQPSALASASGPEALAGVYVCSIGPMSVPLAGVYVCSIGSITHLRSPSR